jgi:hypothetical protein
MTLSGCVSKVTLQPCSNIHFEHSVLNPGTVAATYIGRSEKNAFDFRVTATPNVLTLEEAYSEPVRINPVKPSGKYLSHLLDNL